MKPVNNIVWKDIILIGGKYYAESASVRLCGNAMALNDIYLGNTEAEIIEKLSGTQDGIFDVDDFVHAMTEKYNVDADCIDMLLFDGFDIPADAMAGLPWGEESCGGYINGVSI